MYWLNGCSSISPAAKLTVTGSARGMLLFMTIAERLQTIQAGIKQSALRCGRDSAHIQLMAVSKTRSLSEVLDLISCGQMLFGENRVQEVLQKFTGTVLPPVLPPDFQLHFIGHLQKNKIRKIVPHITCVHSVDDQATLALLSRECTAIGKNMGVYLEANCSGDQSKSGVDSCAALQSLSEYALTLPGIRLEGFMTMGPLDGGSEGARRAFAQLALWRNTIEQECALKGLGLSMGMSHDYHIAIEEGSTMVRIGTALFQDPAA